MSTSSTTNQPAVRTLEVAAAIGFLGIAVFELALALGAPVGRAAWGGSYRQLPAGLRIASAIAVAVWIFASAVVLGRAGIRLVPMSDAFVRRVTGSCSACRSWPPSSTSPRRAPGSASRGVRYPSCWPSCASWWPEAGSSETGARSGPQPSLDRNQAWLDAGTSNTRIVRSCVRAKKRS